MAWGTNRRLRRPPLPTTAPTAPALLALRTAAQRGANEAEYSRLSVAPGLLTISRACHLAIAVWLQSPKRQRRASRLLWISLCRGRGKLAHPTGFEPVTSAFGAIGNGLREDFSFYARTR